MIQNNKAGERRKLTIVVAAHRTSDGKFANKLHLRTKNESPVIPLVAHPDQEQRGQQAEIF